MPSYEWSLDHTLRKLNIARLSYHQAAFEYGTCFLFKCDGGVTVVRQSQEKKFHDHVLAVIKWSVANLINNLRS